MLEDLEPQDGSVVSIRNLIATILELLAAGKFNTAIQNVAECQNLHP